MNRSDELRRLMKTGGEQQRQQLVLSGKDKLRVLRQQKEQQSTVRAAPITATASYIEPERATMTTATIPKPTKVVGISSLLSSKASESARSIAPRVDDRQTVSAPLSALVTYSDDDGDYVEVSSRLPDLPPGFFDDVPAPGLLSTTKKAVVAPAPTNTTVTHSSGGLPAGFFDDPTEDQKDRDMYSSMAADKVEDNDEALEIFLKEVSVPVVDGDIDYENTDDDEDALESAVQIAYEAKILALHQKTEKILGKRAAGSDEVEEEKMRRILQESEEALDVERSLISTSTAEANIDICNLVLQKLVESKDKKRGKLKFSGENDEKNNEYSSLDLFDWTARSIG